MKTMNQYFALSALAVAMMSLYGQSRADEEVDMARIAKPSSSISIGIGNWSNDRPQMGMYDGMRDGDGYLLLDADLVTRDDSTGTWQSLSVRNMGTESPEIRGEYLQQGRQGVSVEYSQLRRDTPYTINTNLLGIGTEEQTVGTNIATGALTGTNVNLAIEREKIGLNFYKNLAEGLDFKINFTNETKKGDRHWGRGGAPEFATEPIDWTTRIIEATLGYTGEKLQLQGGYNGSWFENANDLVCSKTSVQTCWTTTLPYYLSLPMDNQAHQVFLNGNYKFSPTTTGTFRASYTHATQDEHLPTADITGLAWVNAPSSLDGELNTKMVSLGLSSRPMPNLSVVANLRYHDVQDDTPETRIVQTGSPGTTASNTPMSYTTTTGKLEGTYSLSDGYSVTAGLDYMNQDRTVPVGRVDAGVDQERYVPFRAELDELTYRVQLRKSLSETLNGGISYLHAKRDGSDYIEALHSEPGEGILSDAIDPLNIADRKRDKIRLNLDWAPTEKVGLQVNYENGKDEYDGHTYGLREGKMWLVSLDASYVINSDWSIDAWVSHDVTEAEQLGWRQGTATQAELDKESDLRDTGNSIGLGLKGRLSPKLKVGADLQWTRMRSDYDQVLTDTDGGGAGTSNITYLATTGGPLPDITSTTTRIKLFVEYALKKNADLRFDLVHERWKTDDWTWQFSNGTAFQYGATTDGTTVVTDPKQNSTFVGARYIHKF